MANEIAWSLSLKCTNGSFTTTYSKGANADQSAIGGAGGVQSVGTTHEAIGVTDLSTPGWARFTNLDSTNYVELGVDVAASFYPFIKLKAGESAVCRLGTTAPYGKANTSAVKLQYEILET